MNCFSGQLSLAGHEILLLTNLAPALLGIKPLRRIILKHLPLFTLFGVACLANFLYYRTRFRFKIEDAWIRTLLTALGNATMTLAMMSRWWRDRHDAWTTHRNAT